MEGSWRCAVLTDALSQANKDMQEKHGKRKEKSDRFVYRNKMILVPILIPDNGIKCPECDGEGELRVGYDGTHEQDYMECMLCSGKGYLVQEDIDMWNRIGSKHAKETMAKLKVDKK